MSGWKDSLRARDLPQDWFARRARCKKRAGGRCEALSQITDWGKVYDEGSRCEREGSQADHKGDRMDHDNLQWLCAAHHTAKTLWEAEEGRKARRLPRRREERHPGRLR